MRSYLGYETFIPQYIPLEWQTEKDRSCDTTPCDCKRKYQADEDSVPTASDRKSEALQNIEELYETMQQLSTNASAATFEAFGAFFEENCRVHLDGTQDPKPTRGRLAVIQAQKDILKISRLVSSQVVSQSVSDEGRKVFREMVQHLVVGGEAVDYSEMAVFTFDDRGMIEEMTCYGYGNSVGAVATAKTNNGQAS